MSTLHEPGGLHQQVLDFVFARLGGSPEAPAPAGPAAAPAEAGEPPPPPSVHSPEDFRSGAEWLQRERQRLEAYTRTQLARVQEERQALVQQQYLNEQTLVLRCQE